MTVFNFLYYLGMATCGALGSEKVYCMNKCTPFYVSLSSYLTSLGGGLMRDLLLLHIHPFALSRDCLPDMSVALIAGFVYAIIAKSRVNVRFIKCFIMVADALSLGTFIAIGADKAISWGCDTFIVFLSGLLTAIGGGVISSVFSGIPIVKIIRESTMYRAITAFNTIFYIVMITSGVKHDVAQYILVVCTFLAVLVISNIAMENAIARIKKATYAQWHAISPMQIMQWSFSFALNIYRRINYLGEHLISYEEKLKVMFACIRRKRLNFCNYNIPLSR